MNTSTTTIERETTHAKLTLFDNCDGCGASEIHAEAAAHKAGHGRLLFCAHHVAQHAPSLLATGWVVQDERTPCNCVQCNPDAYKPAPEVASGATAGGPQLTI